MILEVTYWGSRNLPITPFLYDIISPETELFGPFQLETIDRPYGFPYWLIICGSLGAFLLCGTMVASVIEGRFYDLS
jgi:hypothetical protein